MPLVRVPDPAAPLEWIQPEHPSQEFSNLPSISLAEAAQVSAPIEITPLNASPNPEASSLPEIPCEVPQAQLDTSGQLPALEGLPAQPETLTSVAPPANPAYIPLPPNHTQNVPLNWWTHYGNLIMSNPLKAFLTVSLTIESLYGLLESVGFVTREYPLIETKLRAHELTAGELNTLMARVIVIIISTVLSAFFALRLNFNKSKTAEELHLFLAVILFFVNIYIFTAFTRIPLIMILQNLGDAMTNLLTSW